jgi:hypothetical protein
MTNNLIQHDLTDVQPSIQNLDNRYNLLRQAVIQHPESEDAATEFAWQLWKELMIFPEDCTFEQIVPILNEYIQLTAINHFIKPIYLWHIL